MPQVCELDVNKIDFIFFGVSTNDALSLIGITIVKVNCFSKKNKNKLYGVELRFRNINLR